MIILCTFNFNSMTCNEVMQYNLLLLQYSKLQAFHSYGHPLDLHFPDKGGLTARALDAAVALNLFQMAEGAEFDIIPPTSLRPTLTSFFH